MINWRESTLPHVDSSLGIPIQLRVVDTTRCKCKPNGIMNYIDPTDRHCLIEYINKDPMTDGIVPALYRGYNEVYEAFEFVTLENPCVLITALELKHDKMRLFLNDGHDIPLEDLIDTKESFKWNEQLILNRVYRIECVSGPNRWMNTYAFLEEMRDTELVFRYCIVTKSSNTLDVVRLVIKDNGEYEVYPLTLKDEYC